MADKSEHQKFDPETDNHPESGECGCVWKHASSISKSKAESHPCHYPWQGVKSLDDHGARYQEDHRGRAVDAGYLLEGVVDNVKTYSIAGKAIHDRVEEKAAERRAKATKSKPFDEKKFFAKFEKLRSSDPLQWLVLEEDGWHVKHDHPSSSASKVPVKKDPALTNVQTFQLKLGRKLHPGQSYPYLHEHHHIIPMDALNRYVLAPEGDGTKKDERIRVLLKAKWNLNNKNNMVVLPCEVVPARVVGLPAHCPWDEADHPKYTDSLKAWLADAKKAIDGAVDEQDHDVIVDAADQLSQVSRDLRDVIYQDRSGSRLAAIPSPISKGTTA